MSTDANYCNQSDQTLISRIKLFVIGYGWSFLNGIAVLFVFFVFMYYMFDRNALPTDQEMAEASKNSCVKQKLLDVKGEPIRRWYLRESYEECETEATLNEQKNKLN